MAFTEYMHGRREQIAWVAETSHGSGGDMANDGQIVGLNARVVPDQFDEGWQEIINAGDTNTYVSGQTAGPRSRRFNLIFTPVDWSWLKYLFSDSPAGSSPTTHTLSIANTIQSFKLEWAREAATNHVITITGCTVNRAIISFQKANGPGQEGLLTVTLECIGKTDSNGSSITSLSALTSDDAWKFLHAKLTVNSSEVTEVNSGEIVLDNGINPDESRYCNSTLSHLMGEPIKGLFRSTGRANVNWKDTTFYTHLTGRTYVSGTNKLEFIKNAADDYMNFEFQNFVVEDAIPETNLEATTAGDVIFTNTGGFATLEAKDDLTSW